MSIQTKIALFALLIGLSEAILLGGIGYSSIGSVSRTAGELRRISLAVEGARSLNAALVRLSDPVALVVNGDERAPERFEEAVRVVKEQVMSCAATSCHGYKKRPPEMAGYVLGELEAIRQKGGAILAVRRAGEDPPLAAWAEAVDGPARRVTHTTEEMSATLMKRAQELEAMVHETEHHAGLLVGFSTLFCIIMAIALCLPIARGIIRPLETLAEQCRSIAAGDFGGRAAEKGPAEIVQLARAYNQMSEDVAAHRGRLIQHQEQLETEVEKRLGELRTKDEELKRSEKLAGVGLIAGTVAHDLNNPLTNILLNAEGLVETAPADTPHRKLLEDILRDAQRCRQIAGDIRALGREGEIERGTCMLVPLVEEAIRLLRFKGQSRRVRVTLERRDEMLHCQCNAQRLLQVFVNLIDNAVDASPENGVVRVRVIGGAAETIIEVEDEGPGISEEAQASLFKPLFTTKATGTGLGLAISRVIVRQHEGRIEYVTRTSDEGPTGTVFRVILPAEAEKNGDGTSSGCSGCR